MVSKALIDNSLSKVLLIVTKPEIGGAQNHVNLLVENLSVKYEITLCSGADGLLLQKNVCPNVRIKILSRLNAKTFFPGLFSLYMLIKSEQPDLIHTHSAIASFVGRIAGRLAGVKTLYTVHGWHFVPNSVLQRRLFGWMLELFARPFTTAWIAVSEYDLTLGIRSGVIDKRRAWMIPNGVEDFDDFVHKSQNSGLDLIFVGRASFQKNCLEAIDILERCDEGVSLTMYVTSGDDLTSLKDRIRLSAVASRVSLITDDPTASDAMHKYDAMLLTSRYEGMPLCVLEAMRSGLPVVATDVCGLSEVVDHGETGFLYELGDVEAAADQVNQLIELDVRKKMSIAARKKYLDNFQAETMAQRTAEIYEKLLS